MCGISGVYFKKKVDKQKKEKFRDAVKTFQYSRGPDAFNELQVEDNLFLFHNRLSIIDLAHAAQPMEDEQSALVFNGEIYNYKNLREKDVHYKYDSDTEVLLKGFAKEGSSFLHKTNSMFGFGFYDKNEKKITLGRDRIGIKQVYYIDNDEVFAFASTLKPLVMFSDKILNKNQLWGYYLNRAFKAPHTIFEDIKEMEAGTLMSFDLSTQKIESLNKWWERDSLENLYTNETEIIENLDGLLHESIQDRLVADVPVGAFLSGGVDSSLVAAIASKYNPQLETFTVALEDSRYDESNYAKAITKKYGLQYHQVLLNGKEFVDEIDDWISMQDDIVANPSSLMLYKLSTLARDSGYKVMLAGEGADEILGGYSSYKRFLMAKQINKYLFFLKPFANPLSNLFQADSRKKFFLKNALSKPAFYGTALIFEPHVLEKMLNHTVQDTHRYDLKNALDLDVKDRVGNDLLTSNGDRATMAASIEVRVPFLSHKMVNYTSKIDSALLMKNNESKYLLKKLAEKYIPHANIYRKKVGFEMPLKDWFRNELKDRLYDLIDNSIQKEVIDINIISELNEAHQAKKIDASGKLWAFMALELSYRDLIKV